MIGIVSLIVILLSTFFTAFLSSIFGMLGGLILMGVLVFIMPVSNAMVLHGLIQLTSNGYRAWLNKKDIKIFKNKKIITRNTHGTGCTLSSAITTFLSCGKPLIKSCALGIKYVNHAIGSSPGYGKGHGPINHINSIELNKKFK